MTGLLLTAALLAALTAVAWRRLARTRQRRHEARAPGASAELALPIVSWDEMRPHVEGGRCGRCGSRLAQRGEGSREAAGRRLRVVRLECAECETPVEVWFDTTALRH